MNLSKALNTANQESCKYLLVLCGVPGCGKSTWAQKVIDARWVSRDNIRLALVGEDEEYFSKEKEVLRQYLQDIKDCLTIGNTIADATHLFPRARKKVLNMCKDKGNIQKVAVWFETPLETCLERNAQRKGRYKVPEEVISRDYWPSKVMPTLQEGFDEIWTVDANGEIVMIVGDIM